MYLVDRIDPVITDITLQGFLVCTFAESGYHVMALSLVFGSYTDVQIYNL